MKKKKFDIEKSDEINFDEDEGEIMRAEDEIRAAAEFFNDIVWWNRHKSYTDKDKWEPDILKKALENAKKIENEISEEHRVPSDDFEWGMINGKLSALRWVLGDYWDNLDT